MPHENCLHRNRSDCIPIVVCVQLPVLSNYHWHTMLTSVFVLIPCFCVIFPISLSIFSRLSEVFQEGLQYLLCTFGIWVVWWVCFMSVYTTSQYTNTHTQYIAQLVERSPRLQNVVGCRAAPFFLSWPCSWIVCSMWLLCMLYMIDLRPVIISALYLSIHSFLMWCFICTLQVPSFLASIYCTSGEEKSSQPFRMYW